MALWQALLLGIIQGVTEFLPISSSGHLVLGQYMLGLNSADGTLFEIFVHFGTVLSIITVYRQTILEMIGSLFSAARQPLKLGSLYAQDSNLKMILFILLSMVPTGLAYVFFGDFLESKFSDPGFVCLMLIVTGILLLLTVLRKNPSGPLTPLKAVIIGAAQAMALFPGISRSGSTICSALYMNVKPEDAANFSFLMLLPVVVGATLLKTLDVLGSPTDVAWLPVLVGTVAAYISGVAAIKLLLEIIRRGKLQYFAAYCIVVGVVGYMLVTG